MASPLRARRTGWVLVIVLFGSYAYFYQAGGWNQNSRFAMVRAVLERHTLQIDAYQLHTGDKALFEGHYYSDKPPGTSLMVIPPVAVARIISEAVGVDPGSFQGIAWTSYVAAVTSAGLFTVLAAWLVYMLGLRWGFSVGAALFAATAYGVTGPAWSYATLFMSHGVTAGCLMAAFYARSRMAERDEARRGMMAALLGASTGWAVVTELQAAIPAIVIVLLALQEEFRCRRATFVKVATALVIPGAACALIMFAYNTLAFHSPFHLGYASEEGFEQLRTGFFGITRPEWWRVKEILVGEYRGILPLFPLLILAPIGLVMLATDRPRRMDAGLALFVGIYYLVLNASYFYWEGGWSYAPRQVTPALPFMALGFLPLWDVAQRPLRALLMAGWIWGVAVTLVAVSTNPQPPSTYKAPMRQLLWPAFRDGDLSLNHQTFVHGSAVPDQMRGHTIPHAAWNLGEVAGLKGHASLVPLGLLWIAGIAALWWL
ncbi:MAG TPA: hypothetical protein VH583_04225 [Vicinamibacterales bacterium]|jgi:4-amino-4-deoxy-L-arabinose transferase-like glycosyltransferase